MKNIFLINNHKNNYSNYSLNEKASMKKRFLVFLLDFALFFILFSLIQGVITNQIGYLLPPISSKIEEINESRSNLYNISNSSSLLEIENNNLTCTTSELQNFLVSRINISKGKKLYK